MAYDRVDPRFTPMSSGIRFGAIVGAPANKAWETIRTIAMVWNRCAKTPCDALARSTRHADTQGTPEWSSEQNRSTGRESSLAYHAFSANFGYFFGRLNPSPTFQVQASSEYNTIKGLIENPAALLPPCGRCVSFRGHTASRLPYTPLTTSMS